MRKIELIAFIATVCAAATPAAAQGKGRGHGNNGVPPGQLPPAGMCRIWIDGVPPGHQPAPTDCATAQAQRPANARIIYGDQTPFPGRRHGNVSNGTIVTRDGRECVRRVDRNGNVYDDCSTRTGSVPSGRRVDEHGHVIDANGYYSAEAKAKHTKGKHGKGKHGQDDANRDYDDDRG